MNPNLLLPEALREAVADYVPVPPDLDGITSGGRRRRRRRDVGRAALGGVVAVAALATATGLTPGGTPEMAPVDDPTPIFELELGQPPSIPYCGQDGIVLADGRVVAAPCSVMVPRAGSTLYLSRRGVEQLVDGRRVLLDGRFSTSWFPAVRNDGRWAAWLAVAPGRPDAGSLLVADLTERSGVTEVPWDTANGWVAGIDDLDRVYVVHYATLQVWAYDLRTGESFQLQDVPQVSSPGIRYVSADGIAVLGPEGVVEGMVTGDGRFTQQRLVDRDWTVFSPDRSRAVHEESGRFIVTGAEGEDPVPIRLPSPGAATWHPVWESDDELIFQFDPDGEGSLSVTASNGVTGPARRAYLLRCDATTGGCEVALPPGWGSGVRGAVYR